MLPRTIFIVLFSVLWQSVHNDELSTTSGRVAALRWEQGQFREELRHLQNALQQVIYNQRYIKEGHDQLVQGIFEAIQNADEESYEYPRTCTEATFATREDGVYNILGASMYCVVDYTNGLLNSWTVIFSRVDGTVDFNGNWEDYKNGFGYDDDYFFKLDWIHATG